MILEKTTEQKIDIKIKFPYVYMYSTIQYYSHNNNFKASNEYNYYTCIGKFCAMEVRTFNASSPPASFASATAAAACMLSACICHTLSGANSSLISDKCLRNRSNGVRSAGNKFLWKIMNII